MLDKALKWIYDNRDFFNPLLDDTDLNIKKMFAELQLALLLGQRHHKFLATSTVNILNKLFGFSKTIIENPAYYEHLLLDLRFYRVSAAPIIYYLTYNNNSILEELVKNSHEKAYNITPELLPYRLLDIEFTISQTKRYTGTNIRAKMEQSVFKAILASSYDVLNWGVSEEYAFTHSIFYATDFGSYNLPNELREKAIRNLPVLSSIKLLVKDFDLLGEYIINMCNLNALKNYREEVYSILMQQQTEGGYIIGPFRKNNDKLDEKVDNKELRNKNIVRNNYHTTLVAIMASICIERGKCNE